MTMKTKDQWNKLAEDNELAFFRGDVCLGSPQSFTLEEKAQICEDMDATNKAIEGAIRADFNALPPEFQDKLLNMLCASGCMSPEWWKKTLLGPIPDSCDQLL